MSAIGNQLAVRNVSQVVCSICPQDCVLLTLSCWKSESGNDGKSIAMMADYVSESAMSTSRK